MLASVVLESEDDAIDARLDANESDGAVRSDERMGRGGFGGVPGGGGLSWYWLEEEDRRSSGVVVVGETGVRVTGGVGGEEIGAGPNPSLRALSADNRRRSSALEDRESPLLLAVNGSGLTLPVPFEVMPGDGGDHRFFVGEIEPRLTRLGVEAVMSPDEPYGFRESVPFGLLCGDSPRSIEGRAELPPFDSHLCVAPVSPFNDARRFRTRATFTTPSMFPSPRSFCPNISFNTSFPSPPDFMMNVFAASRNFTTFEVLLYPSSRGSTRGIGSGDVGLSLFMSLA